MLIHELMRPLFDVDAFFAPVSPSAATRLPVDLWLEDGRYVLEAEVPGARREDLSLELEGQVLTLERKARTTEGEKAKALSRGRAHQRALRRLELARPVEAAKVSATLKDGILRLEIPIADEARRRTIEIR